MKISINRTGDELNVSLRGDMNESCEGDLQDLLGKIELPNLLVDVERVELINSLGARYWINFMMALAKRSTKVRFKRCSPAFIESCNTYPKFAPANSVESLFLPSKCSTCGEVDAQLISKDQFGDQNPIQSLKCTNCGNQLEPSVDVEEFLQSVIG